MGKFIKWFLSSLMVFLIIALLYLPLTTGTVEASGKVIVVKGSLINQKCMAKGKLKACYLWMYNPRTLALFTDKRTLYKLDTGDVPQWKLDSGFGKQVAIKGVVDRQEIVVYDLFPLEGGKKISKSCL